MRIPQASNLVMLSSWFIIIFISARSPNGGAIGALRIARAVQAQLVDSIHIAPLSTGDYYAAVLREPRGVRISSKWGFGLR